MLRLFCCTFKPEFEQGAGAMLYVALMSAYAAGICTAKKKYVASMVCATVMVIIAFAM